MAVGQLAKLVPDVLAIGLTSTDDKVGAGVAGKALSGPVAAWAIARNLDLWHAPGGCKGVFEIDPDWPTEEGRIGHTGFDVGTGLAVTRHRHETKDLGETGRKLSELGGYKGERWWMFGAWK